MTLLPFGRRWSLTCGGSPCLHKRVLGQGAAGGGGYPRFNSTARPRSVHAPAKIGLQVRIVPLGLVRSTLEYPPALPPSGVTGIRTVINEHGSCALSRARSLTSVEQ